MRENVCNMKPRLFRHYFMYMDYFSQSFYLPLVWFYWDGSIVVLNTNIQYWTSPCFICALSCIRDVVHRTHDSELFTLPHVLTYCLFPLLLYFMYYCCITWINPGEFHIYCFILLIICSDHNIGVVDISNLLILKLPLCTVRFTPFAFNYCKL